MEEKSSTGLIIAAVALIVGPLLTVVIIASAIQQDLDDCLPGTGDTVLAAGLAGGSAGGAISAPIEGQIGVAQANIPTRSGAAGFVSSMPKVLAAQPDFVSLNEQRSRTIHQIETAAPGYEAYRPPGVTGQAASTVVLFQAARWDQIDAGQVRLVDAGPQKWDAGRAATWVTVAGTGGEVVSMISVHHMINPARFGPNPPQRRQLYGQGMDRLTALTTRLGARGPVFVAGDFNTRASQADEAWSAAAKMGGAGFGWVNDSIDFIFYPQGGGIRPANTWTGPMDSDHDWVAARFTMNGAGPTGTPPGTTSTNSSGASTTSTSTTPTVAGLDAEQSSNAATIVAVGRGLGVPERGLVVALAAALQESGLRNLDYGDRDSLGLFQQRPSTGWGTPAQIRDPAAAAAAFYGQSDHTTNPGLLDITGWEAMAITDAAQAVQRSGFPGAYGDDEDLATKILTQLDPAAADRLSAATAAATCASGMVPVGTSSCGPTGSPAEDGLSPDGLLVLRCVAGTFGPHTFGGVGNRASNPDSDHPAGRAVDIMINDYTTASGVAEGDAIAAWLQEHHNELGITYVIWRERIWAPGDTGWRTYSHPSGASDPTSRHMDHVHVSVTGDAGTGLLNTTNAAAVTGGGGPVVVPLAPGTYADQDNWRETGPYWSNWHTGNDLSAPCGTPVFAVHAGTVVIDTGQSWAGPVLVKVTTGPGALTTWYAHMETVTVATGQRLAVGQQLGTVGDQGNSGGCHLHLEVHTAGGSIYGPDNVDPMAWIRSNQ